MNKRRMQDWISTNDTWYIRGKMSGCPPSGSVADQGSVGDAVCDVFVPATQIQLLDCVWKRKSFVHSHCMSHPISDGTSVGEHV